MNPHRIYDYLVLARGKILDWSRPLSDEQYRRTLPIGVGTLARTLTHTLQAEWYYVHRIEGRLTSITDKPPVNDEAPPSLADLEAAWKVQSARTRAALAAAWGPVDASSASPTWMTPMDYRVIDDDKREMWVTASKADVFTQLAFHEVHHRAQAMAMLRQLGVANPPPEDLDFNSMMYTRRPV